MSVVQIAFATAIIAGDFGDVMREFEVSEVVIALTVSLMIIGFGIGPLIMAPLVRIHIRIYSLKQTNANADTDSPPATSAPVVRAATTRVRRWWVNLIGRLLD